MKHPVIRNVSIMYMNVSVVFYKGSSIHLDGMDPYKCQERIGTGRRCWFDRPFPEDMVMPPHLRV